MIPREWQQAIQVGNTLISLVVNAGLPPAPGEPSSITHFLTEIRYRIWTPAALGAFIGVNIVVLDGATAIWTYPVIFNSAAPGDGDSDVISVNLHSSPGNTLTANFGQVNTSQMLQITGYSN